jgi:hypothetical protein
VYKRTLEKEVNDTLGNSMTLLPSGFKIRVLTLSDMCQPGLEPGFHFGLIPIGFKYLRERGQFFPSAGFRILILESPDISLFFIQGGHFSKL